MVPAEKTPASRSKRFGAFFLDHILFSFTTILLYLGLRDEGLPNHPENASLGPLLYFIVPLLLLYFLKDILKGQSPGKWVVGISVRAEEKQGEAPSFVRLLLRNLTIPLWPIELLVLSFNKGRRRLGDRLGHTVVVVNSNEPVKTSKVITTVAAGFVMLAAFVCIIGLTLKRSDTYRVAIREIEKNTEIRQRTGGIKGYGLFPLGNISISNDYGQAILDISIDGKESDLKVKAYLVKEPNREWELVSVQPQD